MKNTSYTGTFVRSEKKYILSAGQYEQMISALQDHTLPDAYGKTNIYTIYYDTPDYLLIRRSLEKPVFKEKLRLRTYKIPNDDDPAYIEIKRKYNKVVYKRRFSMPYRDALKYFEKPCAKDQIAKEIGYALRIYPNIRPAVSIAYSRVSRIGREDPTLRITFDSNILWRNDPIDLRAGAVGMPLLQAGDQIMELKFTDSVPLWLAHLLDRFACRPSSFSKCGEAYMAMLRKKESDLQESSLKGDMYAYHF